ncbi:MAG: hypothetical protein IJ121_05955 [Eubacterium sp.]|nr:hypothetical protein [Eubacterium sp.]
MRRIVTYLLAAVVAVGTTHAMILPALGVDVNELVGEADVGGVTGAGVGEGLEKVAVSDADVGEEPVIDVDETSDVNVGMDADVVMDVGVTTNAGMAAGVKASTGAGAAGVGAGTDAGAAEGVEAGTDAGAKTGVEWIADAGIGTGDDYTAKPGSGNDSAADSGTGVDATAESGTIWERDTATGSDEFMDAQTAENTNTAEDPNASENTVNNTDPGKNGSEFADELYAETENFAVTVFCNSSGETLDAADRSEIPDEPVVDEPVVDESVVDEPIVTGPQLKLEEAEESSEIFTEAKAALTELRREENESYSPVTENLAVLEMQLEDIDPADSIKINLRVRQMPDEISSEAFIRTAEIHRLQQTEEDGEDSADVPSDEEAAQQIKNPEMIGFQTTEFQASGFRMEQGVLSADLTTVLSADLTADLTANLSADVTADLTTDLQEDESLSIVISWAAEEQEVSPASGEFIGTAGTEIEDTTAIGISADGYENDVGSSDTLPDTTADITDMQMAEEDSAAASTKDSTTDAAADDEMGSSSNSEQSEPDYNGYELPATGGPGRKPYRVAGGVLSAAALIALQIAGPEKRKERRHKTGP